MKKLIALTLLTLSAAVGALAGEVALYFAPNFSAPIAFRVADTHPGLKSAKPAPNAAKGWYVVNWKGLYTGWSPQANVLKDLTLDAGAPIYVKPSRDSMMLGSVPQGVAIAVSEIVDGWAKVKFTATIPLYFFKETPVAKPVVVTRAMLPQGPSAVSDATRGNLYGHPRFYKGTLKERRTMFTFKQAPFDYQLDSLDNGGVVGLVDFKDLISSTPTSAYLNKEVNIYGIGYPLDRYPFTVIKVKYIQLLDGSLPVVQP